MRIQPNITTRKYRLFEIFLYHANFDIFVHVFVPVNTEGGGQLTLYYWHNSSLSDSVWGCVKSHNFIYHQINLYYLVCIVYI
jgi:hypothetical protein